MSRRNLKEAIIKKEARKKASGIASVINELATHFFFEPVVESL